MRESPPFGLNLLVCYVIKDIDKSIFIVVI